MCSQSCGGGNRERTRTCVNGDVGEIGCHEGAVKDVQGCNNNVRCDFSYVSWQYDGNCIIDAMENFLLKSQ